MCLGAPVLLREVPLNSLGFKGALRLLSGLPRVRGTVEEVVLLFLG